MENLEKVYKRGARDFVTCTVCHSELAGKHRFGPSLYGVFGNEVAQHLTSERYPYTSSEEPNSDAYRYSKAFHEMEAKELSWTLPALWSFVYDQESFVSNSRMAFPGLKSIGESLEAKKTVQNVIHYLAWSCRPACGSDFELIQLDIDALADMSLEPGKAWEFFLRTPNGYACALSHGAGHNLSTDPSLFVVPIQGIALERC